MTANQSIPQEAIKAAIGATKASIMAAREADNPFNNARLIHTTKFQVVQC